MLLWLYFETNFALGLSPNLKWLIFADIKRIYRMNSLEIMGNALTACLTKLLKTISIILLFVATISVFKSQLHGGLLIELSVVCMKFITSSFVC